MNMIICGWCSFLLFSKIYISLISFLRNFYVNKTPSALSELELMPYDGETIFFVQLSKIIWDTLKYIRYIHKDQCIVELK